MSSEAANVLKQKYQSEVKATAQIRQKTRNRTGIFGDTDVFHVMVFFGAYHHRYHNPGDNQTGRLAHNVRAVQAEIQQA